jgi:hypothetical protein
LTAWLSEAPTVDDEIVPISRIEPSVRTCPEMIAPIAASTFDPGRL